MIARLRRWLPAIATCLFLLTAVMASGAVCVCGTDHQIQNVQQIVKTFPAVTAAVIEVWGGFLIVLVTLVSGRGFEAVPRRDRASPAVLQRFLI
jgi:hypothetical protein